MCCNAGGLAQTAQISLDNEFEAGYGPSFRQLSVDITPETASRLHVKIKPVGQQRWEVPETMVPRYARFASPEGINTAAEPDIIRPEITNMLYSCQGQQHQLLDEP